MPDSTHANIFLQGARVFLRPVETSDAPLLQKWGTILNYGN
jgi:hypothetical protein